MTTPRRKTIVAPLYPNTKRQLATLAKLDGMLLDASQCFVEQIEGKVRRLIFNLFDGQAVRARTTHPYGTSPVQNVTVKRKGDEWVGELTFAVSKRRARDNAGDDVVNAAEQGGPSCAKANDGDLQHVASAQR